MKLRSSIFFFVICLFCHFQPVLGQDYIYNTYDITRVDGLLSNRVSFVYQDADGFIWLRNLDGLARYDGHSFKWFTKLNTDLRGIPRENLLVEDAEGYFWFTDGNYVDLMHRKTFEVLTLEEKFPEGVPFETPVEQFWQGINGGIYLRELGTESFYYYHPDSGFQHLPYIEGAGSVWSAPDGLWAHFPENGWRKYDYQTGKLLKSFKMDMDGSWITNYRTGEDWIAYYNSNLRTITIYRALKDRLMKVMAIPVGASFINQKPYVIYNSLEDQLVLNGPYADHSFSLIDLEQQQVIPVREADTKKKSPHLRTLFLDDKGVYWQQSPRGLRLLKVSKPIFSQYANGLATRGLWANDDFLIIQRDFVAMEKPNTPQKIPTVRWIQSTLATETKELWLGGGYGIFHLDTADLSVKEHIPFYGERTMWSILRDQDSTWWGGLFQHGIAIKTKEDTALIPFEKLNGFTSLAMSTVVQLREEGPYIWAVTNSGLYLIHKDGGVLHRYHSTAQAPFRLPLDDVHFIHQDQAGVYWVATNADGLIRFELNPELGVSSVRQYTTDHNLSSNVLYAIVEDTHNRLWISTLNGITCFNKETEETQLFLEEDGLSQLEFNRISYFQDQHGRIYFGTINGVVAFHPDEVLEAKAYHSPIVVSDLSLYDGESKQLVNPKVNSLEQIVLQPKDRFFRMSVSMVDYFNANRLTYSYQIEGLFDDFQKIRENVIEISGLPYGEYTLRVRGQSTNRRYSTQELVLPIIVKSPIYYRWWFILLAASVLIALAILVYQWRIRQLEDRRRVLERLVDDRTAKIAQQAKQLKALDELKSRFFANISHELRTPLTLILSPIEQMLESDEPHPQTYTYLQLMRQNGHKLLKRINELLDLSRLDANRLAVNEQPTTLYSYFKTLLAGFESTAQIKSVQLLFSFHLDEHVQILLDRDKVEKIISNFMSNALKFTPEGGQIRCQVQKQSHQLLISISDTGMGILPEELPYIFDRFYQGKQTSQVEGTGIGLAICLELAEVLGGKVWATNNPVGPDGPTGSTFYLQLPIVETFAPQERVSAAPTKPVPEATELIPPSPALYETFRPTVMVVEDNPDMRSYVRSMLDREYQVTTAANGQEALDMIAACKARPDLIISDIMMPVMDGMELLSQVKAQPCLQQIPMIMLTARQGMEIKLEALRIGVDDYLTKPFQPVELKARVDNLIQHSANRQLEVNKGQGTKGESLSPMQAVDLEWLRQLEQIIQENIANKQFKLADAAIQMNLSYRRLQQKLKAMTGLSPKQYQQSIRLAKAREILKSGEVQTVQEAMYQIGLDNYYHFTKLYVEAFGVKPIDEIK